MAQITLFAKKRTSKDGRPFYTFLGSVPKKDGTSETMAVRFKEDCTQPKPERCPMNIVVSKENANISERKYTREDTGEEAVSRTLWVSDYSEGDPFVDKSLDDYDF